MAFAFCGAEGMRVKSIQGLLATLRCRAIFLYPGTDTLSEWLRRWARNPLGSARKGLNPLGVALLARYVAGVWKPLPQPLRTRLKSIEVITGARGASHLCLSRSGGP